MPSIQVHFIAHPSDQLVWIHVPDTEIAVLRSLGSQKWIGPEISRATNGKISPAAVNTLLKRLVGRGLVDRNEKIEKVRGVDMRRVEYFALIDHLYNPMDEQNKTAR